MNHLNSVALFSQYMTYLYAIYTDPTVVKQGLHLCFEGLANLQH